MKLLQTCTKIIPRRMLTQLRFVMCVPRNSGKGLVIRLLLHYLDIYLSHCQTVTPSKGPLNSIFLTQTTGENCNSPGHSINNVTVKVIEKVMENNEGYRKERETTDIRKFTTFYKGLYRLAITHFVTNCYFIQ